MAGRVNIPGPEVLLVIYGAGFGAGVADCCPVASGWPSAGAAWVFAVGGFDWMAAGVVVDGGGVPTAVGW